jgi:site-specific DNA recombinase
MIISTSAPNAKPWVAYVRVSTEEQSLGHSLDSQAQICRNYAAQHGLALMDTITDAGLSAKNLMREGMGRIRELAAAGAIGGVLVSKLDRMSRSLMDMLTLVAEFEAAQVEMQCVLEPLETRTPSGKMLFRMRAIFAEYEREQIADRQRISNAYRRQHGFFAGGCIPAGFRSVGDDGKRKLEPDPVWGPVVAACWLMVENGCSLRDCATYLHEQGVPCRTKGRWSTSTVSNFFRKDWACPGLVTREQHERARAILSQRHSPHHVRRGPRQPDMRPSPSPLSTRVWPLQGVGRCAHCGSALVGTHGNGNGGRYNYLQCCGRAHQAKGSGACRATRLPAEAWERAVVEALRYVASNDDVLLSVLARETAAWTERTAPMQRRRLALQSTRDEADRTVTRLVRLAAENDLLQRAVAEELGSAQRRKEQALAELASVESDLQAAREGLGSFDDIVGLLKDGLAELAHADPQQQRLVLSGLLAWVKMGTTSDGPMPLELGLRIPTAAAHRDATSGCQAGRGPGSRGPGSPRSAQSAFLSKVPVGSAASQPVGGPPMAETPGNAEPLADTRGSDSNTIWRRGRDSNPRYHFW